jgi:hypothetical protein
VIIPTPEPPKAIEKISYSEHQLKYMFDLYPKDIITLSNSFKKTAGHIRNAVAYTRDRNL